MIVLTAVVCVIYPNYVVHTRESEATVVELDTVHRGTSEKSSIHGEAH